MHSCYPKLLTLLLPLFCITSISAQPVVDHIINGSTAPEGKWPFMVSLHYKGYSEPFHSCGGALVSPTQVLTAAHCIVRRKARSLQIVIGTRDLSDGSGERFDVTRIEYHPGYDDNLLVNDIALLTLDGRPSINPVPIIGADEAAIKAGGATAYALGWGFIDPEYPILPHLLQEVSIPIHSDTDCLNNIGLLFFGRHMICAGVLSSDEDTPDGLDSCRGDSGGPLLVDDGGTFKLVGLTSWGFECASHKTYGVYTDVHNYLDWLEPRLNPEGVLVEAIEEFKQELQDMIDYAHQSPSSKGAEDQWEIVQDLFSVHAGTDTFQSFPKFNNKMVRRMNRKMNRILRSFYKPKRRVRVARSLIRHLDRMIRMR